MPEVVAQRARRRRAGRSSSARGSPTDTIATMVSCVCAAADAVAVPGHAVAAVAVEAQPGRRERLAELGGVVRVERGLGRFEQRVGQRLVLVVEREQPRDVHDPVVHLPPLGVPGHGVAQPLEQRVGAD